MKTLLSAIVLLSANALLAMPCDTSYTCISSTYKIEVQRCREVNRLGSLTVEKNNKEVNKAKLGPAWDGDTVLALQVDLPSKPETSRIVTIEANKDSKLGILKEKYASDIGVPYKELLSESVKCEITEDMGQQEPTNYLEGA